MSYKIRFLEDENSGEDKLSLVIHKDMFTKFMINIMKAYNKSQSSQFKVDFTGRLYREGE